MEQQLNGLGKTIMAADPARIRLDQTVKNVLAYKPLLARIFKEVVEFTTNTDDPVKYGNIKKVYSIWICTETAQKRANSIEKYAVKREFLVGSNTDEPRYDIMNAIVINISGKHDVENTDNELIRLLTDLFDERMNGAEKVAKLKEKYGLRVTREVEREVSEMCTYASAIEKKGIENGLKALVRSLKEFISEFDPLYQAVIRNEEYANVSRDKVREYFDELDGE